MTGTTETGHTTARRSDSPLRLLRRTAGGPRAMADKLASLARRLATYADADAVTARLEQLAARGYIDEIPNRVQLLVGSIDMLRFWISPAAAEYYRSVGINFTFHQLLRILDDPCSMIDPTGLLSERDTIIGHLMQVVHANPCYDLQLLEVFPDGLDELERQVREMIEGTHPRAASIGAIVEDPDYHRRLLDYVQAYRADPEAAAAPLRDNISQSPRWRPIERTFGTLPAAMAYFARLPATPGPALAHLVTVRRFPEELAAP